MLFWERYRSFLLAAFLRSCVRSRGLPFIDSANHILPDSMSAATEEPGGRTPPCINGSIEPVGSSGSPRPAFCVGRSRGLPLRLIANRFESLLTDRIRNR